MPEDKPKHPLQVPVELALTAVVDSSLHVLKLSFPLSAGKLWPHMLDVADHVAADYPEDFGRMVTALARICDAVFSVIREEGDAIPACELKRMVEEARAASLSPNPPKHLRLVKQGSSSYEARGLQRDNRIGLIAWV